MQPIVIHLDMNSYFASVEQQDNVAYRGKVLGVCEHLGGIIIAASKEAKRWGIKTGTPVWEAKKLYPKIILVHTRAEAYREYHRRFLKVMRDYSNFVEPASIDEAYADVTRTCNVRVTSEKCKVQSMANPWEEAVRVAMEIKQRMKKEVGDYLTCSIGIAENKLLAKIASDLLKPDGLVVITPVWRHPEPRMHLRGEGSNTKEEILQSAALPQNDATKRVLFLSKEDLYDKLKLTDIPGIAHRQEKRLNNLGIRTLKELRDYPLSRLIRVFGIVGYHLHHMGQLTGSWKSSVSFDETIKSIGHMYTLPKEFRKREFFEPVLYKLCEMVAERLRKKNLMGNIVAAYVRDGEYNSYGHSVKLSHDIFDARDLFWECRHILLNYPGISEVIGKCKLIGVTISGLKPFIFQQSLFKKHTAKASLMRAIDVVNAKYGKFTLSYTPVLKAGKVFRDSVGFGRVKEVGDYSESISIRPGKGFKK